MGAESDRKSRTETDRQTDRRKDRKDVKESRDQTGLRFLCHTDLMDPGSAMKLYGVAFNCV